HPRIEFPQIEVRRVRHGHFVKCFFLSQKLRYAEIGTLVMLEEKSRDIKSRQINSVVNAVVVWVAKVAIVPGFEIAIEHQVELEMNMGPRLIQSFACVTHARDAFAAIHSLTNAHRDLA